MSFETANSFQSLCGDSSAPRSERIGFMDEIGGSVDGFISCTEALGSESTENGSSMDEFDGGERSANSTRKRMRERSPEGRREVRKFPPPLTSLNRYGWPSFVLRPVRKDGRLELTEVKIRRSEILRASRQNGRLTIHLVKYADDDHGDDTEEAGYEVLNEEEEGWRFAVLSDGAGGEGLRRCYRDRHGHLDVWGPRCVTTR